MKKKRAWLVSVDMGYGHQRAAYPLRDIANERILNVNHDKSITEEERKQWLKFKNYYERISNLRSFPVIGRLLWMIYGKFQSIRPIYPFRDLSKPNLGSVYMHRLIKKGFNSSLIEYVKKNKLPFITTFFAPALAAANKKMKDVYCVVTDSDINRIWVPEFPKKDRITYLTPSKHGRKFSKYPHKLGSGWIWRYPIQRHSRRKLARFCPQHLRGIGHPSKV